MSLIASPKNKQRAANTANTLKSDYFALFLKTTSFAAP